MKRILYAALLLGGLSTASLAAVEAEKGMYFTPKVGISAFTGLLGFEAQFNHIAFDIGLPLSGGVRYYFRPHTHSWFAGLYGSGWGYDHDETIDGVAYTHFSRISGGGGGGYRWFWRQRWSLELGLTVGYQETHHTNTYYKRTETSVSFFPVAAAGFSFW